MSATGTTGDGSARPDDCNSAPALIYDEQQLHQRPEVMNPPQSAAQGCEARNLIADHVMGMGHVHRAAKTRPADAVPPPYDEQQLEAAISAAMERMCAAPDREDKLVHWREMVRLMDTRVASYTRFLARLEQMEWEYEFEGYELDNGERYLPDFWLPRFHYPMGIYVEVKPPGMGFDKPVEFVMSGGGAILCAGGVPCAGPYHLIEPDYSHPKGLMDARATVVAFKAKYLPGGANESEYRLYWDPQESELDYMEVKHAIYAARSARFEHRAAAR